MADGDVAASLGWSVPAQTEDKRNGWQRIAQALDKIASHIISGTHPWSAITGKPASFPTVATSVTTQGVDGAHVSDLQTDLLALNGASQEAKLGLLYNTTYNRFIGGTWRSVVIQDDGQLGQRSSSSSRYKAQIEPAPIDWRVLLRSEELEPVSYVRRDELARARRDGREPQRHVGLIAERLHRAGLGAFVQYDAQDRPDGIHYDELAIAAIGGLRELTLELDELRTRLDKAGI